MVEVDQGQYQNEQIHRIFQDIKKRAVGEITLCNQSQSCTIVTKMTILFRFLLQRGGWVEVKIILLPIKRKVQQRQKIQLSKKDLVQSTKRTKFTEKSSSVTTFFTHLFQKISPGNFIKNHYFYLCHTLFMQPNTFTKAL